MFSKATKVRSRTPSQSSIVSIEGKQLQRIDSTQSLSSDDGMYFDTTAALNKQLLLLPEESCLAEDENCVFHVHCEREGFHLFGWGDVNFNHIQAKVYLTNHRVHFQLGLR
jgi:hypothetical protein